MKEIDYNDIDPECRDLVKAINRLPGIRTVECCCGHGKSEYHMFMRQEDKGSTKGLSFLAKLISRRYYNFVYKGWNIVVDEISDVSGEAIILLVGPKGEQAYHDAEKMAEDINEAVDTNEWPLCREVS